eukprot:537578-Hanusia_phi.AAC.2
MLPPPPVEAAAMERHASAMKAGGALNPRTGEKREEARPLAPPPPLPRAAVRAVKEAEGPVIVPSRSRSAAAQLLAHARSEPGAATRIAMPFPCWLR